MNQPDSGPTARAARSDRADFAYADRVFRHRFGESDAAFMTRLARAEPLRS
jgi:hypothetical protein